MASVPLIVAGGVVQSAGFGLALWQSVRTRREQSPNEQSLPSWTRAWTRHRGTQFLTWSRRIAERALVRLHVIQPRTVAVPLSGKVGMSANLRAQLINRRRSLPLTERIDRLEDDVDDLRRKQSQDRADLEGRINEVHSDIESQQAAEKSERARQLGQSLRYQEVGILVFMVGVALTTVGSV